MDTQHLLSVKEDFSNNDTKQPVSTLLVSSNALVLRGIATMLKNVRDVSLLGHSPGKIDMMLMIDDLIPSLIVINDDEAGSDPPDILETISLARHEYPNLNILILLNNHDTNLELSALRSGVKGILSGEFDKKTLTDCIRHISSGGLWLRRIVMERFISEQLYLNRYKEKTPELKLLSFTRRELQIIQLASKGQKNREIGGQLYISEKTVKHHMSRIFKKLKIQKRSQLKGLI